MRGLLVDPIRLHPASEGSTSPDLSIGGTHVNISGIVGYILQGSPLKANVYLRKVNLSLRQKLEAPYKWDIGFENRTKVRHSELFT